jgi:1-deoxy-D-xylulose-5-phosphate synthase
VLAVDRAGIVGADGETHQGCFDVGILRQTPGMRIYAPANYAELRSMLRKALDGSGSAAVRYPRGSEGDFARDTSAETECLLRDGSDVTIVSHGILINQALTAAEKLAEKGISAKVIKLNRLDISAFPVTAQAVGATGRLIVAEEICAHGCMGSALVTYLAENGVAVKAVRLLNLGDGVVPQGSVSQLWKMKGIDAPAIAGAAEEIYEKSKA